ncbi:MAG TPA: hypothetical protein PLF01_02180 [Alphaproteobacteria bacterium]|nr:hypothetical protein [Alphaproteobacteria bacterium]
MKKLSLSLFSALVLVGACTIQTDYRQQTASHIARPAFMVERFIPAGNFQLMAWERMHKPNDVATVYIEGDGFNQSKKSDTPVNAPQLEPTPENPVALHLASRDLSKNLAYIARPCQYMMNPESKGCSLAYTKSQRFAPEVMNAYEAALNDIAARYHITGFHLVGYDGGANIAAVLAARRQDVLSLRTVAGNLNPELTAENNETTGLASSAVLGIDYGSALSNVPQHHFIGAADDVITPSVYHSYRQMVGLSDCIHYSLVQDADHTRGWVEKWPELLKLQPQCATVHQDLPPLPPVTDDFPGDYNKGPKYSK